VLDRLKEHAVTLDDIIKEAVDLGHEGLADFFRDRSKRRIIAGRLDKAGYVPIANPDAKDKLWRLGGKRCAIYAPKRLSSRKAVELVQKRVAAPGDGNVGRFSRKRGFWG
jgi:hypothetical protein